MRYAFITLETGVFKSYKLKTPSLIVVGGLSLANRSGVGVGG